MVDKKTVLILELNEVEASALAKLLGSVSPAEKAAKGLTPEESTACTMIWETLPDPE